jgi:hypothetical protein
MTIARNQITAISTSGVRLLAQLRGYGHRANWTEVAGPVEASTEQARPTGCPDPGPAGLVHRDGTSAEINDGAGVIGSLLDLARMSDRFAGSFPAMLLSLEISSSLHGRRPVSGIRDTPL